MKHIAIQAFHTLYYAFYIIILTLDRNKGFAIGRATFGPILITGFLLITFTLLICSMIFCYEINSLILFGVSFAISFILNEYYFTYLEIGEQIVELKPVVINVAFTVIFAALTFLIVIVFMVWSFNYSRQIFLSCN